MYSVPPRILTRGIFSLLAFLAILFDASFTQADIYNDGDALPGSITSSVTFNFDQSQSYSGIISGAGTTVTKTGTGVLTLSGANTYTGTTTINGGGLTLTNGGVIAGSDITVGSNAAAAMTIESGATVTSNGAIYVGLDSGSDGTLNITGGTVNAYWLRPGRNASSKGVVNISGGVVTVSKPSSASGYDESEIGNNGSGKITVSGDGKLSFTGTVRIANMGNAESFINIQDYGEVTVNNNLYVGQRGTNLGSMTLSGHGQLTVKKGIQLGTDYGSNGSGNMTLKDYASVTISPDGDNTTDAVSNIGNYAGTNTLDLSGNSSFEAKQIQGLYVGYGYKNSSTHNANVTGNIKVADNATFTANPTVDFILGNYGTGKIEQSGGTVNLKTGNSSSGTVFLANFETGKGIIDISGGTFNIGTALMAGTRGASTIDLSGTGIINADGIVILAPGYETTSNTTVNQTGGTFNANAGIVYGNYFANRGTGVYNLSAGTLNTTSITYGRNTPASASFVISGTGVANITGALAVPTNVKGGTLTAGSIAIPASGKLDVSGGTIKLGNGGITAAGAYTFNLSGGTLATNGASWSSSLNATTSNTITFSPEADQTITWSGVLSGTGALTKAGVGELVLTGKSTFKKDITINGGVLDLTNGAVYTGGYISDAHVYVNDGGTLKVNNFGYAEGGASSLGGLTYSSNGSTNFHLNGGAVQIAESFVSPIARKIELQANGGTLDLAEGVELTLTGDIHGVGALTKAGAGKLTLTANNSYTGGTTISAGTLVLSENGALGTGAVVNNAALVFAHDSDQTFNNAVSGTGAVTKTGAGTLSLTNANSYTGGTTISAGTLVLSENGALGTGAVVNNAALVFAHDSDQTFNNAVSGTGAVTKTGSGTLSLTNANSYEGGTTISAGTLVLSENGTLGTGAVIDNATLVFAHDSDQTFNNAVSGTGTVSKTGAGKLKIDATENLFQSSQFTVEAGELDFKGNYSGNLYVKSGATLSPGNSVGDLAVSGNVVIDDNGTILFEFGSYNNGSTSQNYDTLAITNADDEFSLDTGSIVKLFFEGNDASVWAADNAEYLLVSDPGFVSEETSFNSLLGNYQDLFGLQGRADGLYLVSLGVGPGPSPDPGSGVPEPSTWALLALGVVVLFLRKRKN